MYYEPPILEIYLTRLAFRLCGRSVYKEYADRLLLTGKEKVLDFGCGMGTIAYYVLKKLPLGYLTCIDISNRWLTECRKTLRRYTNVSYYLGDVYSLSLPVNYYDMIFSHFVLHDIPDNELMKVIPALAGLLKPSGRLAFREPLQESKKLGLIQNLLMENGLLKKDSRITDVPLMSYTLESIYVK